MRYAIFNYFLLSTVFLCVMVKPVHHVGDLGDIVTQNQNFLFHGGVLDDILLYPYRNEEKKEQIMRKGQFAHYDTAEANVIICHGFSCNHSDVSVLRYVFDSGKYNVLNFDFRAHGDLVEQDGVKQYCTFGKDEVLDLSAAIEFIKNYPDNTISSKPIVLYGFSMGAAIAVLTAQNYGDSIKGLVLDCPFDSSYGVVKRGLNKIQFEILGYQFSLPGVNMLKHYAFHPYVQSVLKPLLKFVAHFDTQNIETDLQPVAPVKSIKKVGVPILFIHCKNDEKIPLDAVMKLYQKAPGIKRLWVTEGKKHFGSFFHRPETYKTVVQSFLNSVLKQRESEQELLVREKIVVDNGQFDNVQLVSELNF